MPGSGLQVSTEGYLFPSHLVLTATHIIKLRDRNPKLSAVLSRRPLTTIAKITAKKKHPNLLTVVFESELASSAPPSPQVVAPAVEDVANSPAAAAAADPPAGEANADPGPPQSPQFEIGDEDDSVDHSFADDVDAPSPSEGPAAASASNTSDLISLGDPAAPSGDLISLDSPAPAPAPAPAPSPGGDLISLGGEIEPASAATTDGTAEGTAGPIVSPESPPPSSPGGGGGGGDAASGPSTPNGYVTDGRYVEVREMYMIPEATKAKAAFRDSIIALAEAGLSQVNVTPNSKD